MYVSHIFGMFFHKAIFFCLFGGEQPHLRLAAAFFGMFIFLDALTSS